MTTEQGCWKCGLISGWRRTTTYDYLTMKRVTVYRCMNCSALKPKKPKK